MIPAFAGMLLAEQGHEVVKWVKPEGRDPVQDLIRGDELWEWINHGKRVIEHEAKQVRKIDPGSFDVVIENIRAETWAKWQIDPDQEAERLELPWVAMRDDFGGRSFDAIAQARAWGDHLGYLPAYLGDTTGGLWMAFKALSTVTHRQVGLHILHQAACLAKLIEGEGVVSAGRDGHHTPFDEIGTYGLDKDGTGVKVEFRGEVVREPFRDERWRREYLRHLGGRYVI